MGQALLSVYALQDAMASWVRGGNVRVRLFVNDYEPRFVSDVANFVEANYDTYPAGGVSLNPMPVLQAGNRLRFNPLIATFPAPHVGGPVLLFGWFVTYTAAYDLNTHVLTSSRFAPHLVNLFNDGSPLTVVVTFSDYGEGNP